jgi:rubrerythrin
MNKRYVDIDKFKEQIQKAVDNYWLGFSTGYHLAEDVIEEINYGNFDTADVEEVRHGKWEKRSWIIFDSEKVGFRCSECNTTWDSPTKYCPNCGSKMTEE